MCTQTLTQKYVVARYACVCVCAQGPTFRGFKLFIGPRGSAGRVWGTVHRATQGVRPYTLLYIYIHFFFVSLYPPSFSVRRSSAVEKKGFFKIYTYTYYTRDIVRIIINIRVRITRSIRTTLAYYT